MYDYYPHRLLARTVAPASEPVTLAEAKLYLRVDGTGEDSLITSMIAAAREAAEQYLRRSLITQTWKVAYDDAMPDEVKLPFGPVQSITSVKSITSAGVETTISASTYTLNAAKDTLCFDASVHGFVVEIVYVAGYGASASSVPSSIRLGLMSHLSALFDARGQEVAIPPSAVMLYQPFREVRL